MTRDRPRVAITMGDPAGIGPEIVVQALNRPSIYEACRPVIVGSEAILERVTQVAKLDYGWRRAERVEVEVEGIEGVAPGLVSVAGGRAAAAYLRRACELSRAGAVAALCTAPIHKGALRLAGVEEIGHTELLGAFFGVSEPLTVFLTEGMRIFFYSRHLSLRQAIEALHVEGLVSFMKRVDEALTHITSGRRVLGLAALNPHAGDVGQFGDEEERILAPAVALAREQGIEVEGPIAADSIFHLALTGRYAGVIALYHDQGHIAAKTRDFFGTVTATLGLPVLRTSVDHGPAMDLAWTGRASARGMERAIIRAAELLE